MQKLLLTVQEAADVPSVSRPRVYGLISAELLDSVKIVGANPQDASAASALDGRTEGPTLRIGEAGPHRPARKDVDHEDVHDD
jgi:hypothetical protein